MSMKNSIGNRTRDLPGYSAVPQPTAPRVPPPSSGLLAHDKVFFLNINQVSPVTFVAGMGVVMKQICGNIKDIFQTTNMYK
jgi:hypothetical protein